MFFPTNRPTIFQLDRFLLPSAALLLLLLAFFIYSNPSSNSAITAQNTSQFSLSFIPNITPLLYLAAGLLLLLLFGSLLIKRKNNQ